MKASTRLGLYGAGLALVFGVAFVAAGAVIPEETVRTWTEQTDGHAHDDDGDGDDSARTPTTVCVPENGAGVTDGNGDGDDHGH